MMVETLVIIVLSLILNHAYAQPQQHEYDVIIMGAGASGIGAAKRLYEANVTNILIIEAQDYIGGRAKVVNFSNVMLNVGASWISGACIDNCSHYNQTNPMLAAAYKYNFSFLVQDWQRRLILDFGGNEYNVTNSDNRYNKFYEAQDCAWNIIKTRPESYDDMSYFAALSLCGWSKPRTAIDKTIQWSNFEMEYGQHAKWSKFDFGGMSYENYSHDIYGPNDLFITDPRGYQGIIEALASEFLDIDNIDNEEKIILNSPITTIQYDENGVTVTLDESNNNSQYSAKYAIVTFSLGVLQSDIVEFVPKLPSWKIDALLAFDYTESTPILIKWPYNFWSDTIVDNSQFILLNDDRFGFFTRINLLDLPHLFNASLIWRMDISLDLAKTVAYQSINDTIKQIIDLKLKHYFDDIPFPDDILVASWHANTYFQGSYTNWPVGFIGHSQEAMSWPLLSTLFFAGGAYHFDYDYLHTAYINGNDTANNILSCMAHDCPGEYIPPSHDNDCKTEEESVFKQLVWLWIVLGVLFGVLLGYVLVKYCSKVAENKGALDAVNLGPDHKQSACLLQNKKHI